MEPLPADMPETMTVPVRGKKPRCAPEETPEVKPRPMDTVEDARNPANTLSDALPEPAGGVKDQPGELPPADPPEALTRSIRRAGPSGPPPSEVPAPVLDLIDTPVMMTVPVRRGSGPPRAPEAIAPAPPTAPSGGPVPATSSSTDDPPGTTTVSIRRGNQAPPAGGAVPAVPPVVSGGLKVAAGKSETADLPPPMTVSLHRGGPLRSPVLDIPAREPPSSDAPGTTTVPVRRGHRPSLIPVESPAGQTEAGPETVAAGPSCEIASEPAKATQTAPELLCPRCGSKLISPEGLGLCQSCGYCRSLEEDRAKVRAATGRASRISGLGIVEFWNLLQWLPGWCWVLLAGAVAVVLISVAGTWVLPEHAWHWSLLQLGAGLLSVLSAQIWALVMMRPHDERLGPKDAVLPARLWNIVFRWLPETRGPVWLGSWGTVLVLCALVGGLFFGLGKPEPQTAAHDQRGSLGRPGEKKFVAKDLRDAAAALEKNNDQSLLEEAIAGLTETLPTFAIEFFESKPEADNRPSIHCVVIGYVAEKAEAPIGLIVATVKEGRLHFAGVVQQGVEELGELRQQLPSLEGQEIRIPDVNLKAYWVKPKVFCEVRHSELDEQGRLRDPNVKGVLQVPENDE